MKPQVVFSCSRFGSATPASQVSFRLLSYALCRHVSTSSRRRLAPTMSSSHAVPEEQQALQRDMSSLGLLPSSSVLRSYMIMAVSSRPAILEVCTRLLRHTLHPKPSLVFDVERNIVLRWMIRHSFYNQFCAGETSEEISRCMNNVKRIGFSGIILEYAKEVLEEEAAHASDSAEKEATQVHEWRDGLLRSIEVVNKGDFIGLKWSGMGPAALQLMKSNKPPSPLMEQAMIAICEAAAARGVLLLPAAEPQNAQSSVDAWTLQMSRKYNKLRPGHAVLYNTYQTYLKSTPKTLSQHLTMAKRDGFTLGIKLVRGAYLHSEPRHLIWDSKEETDQTYNSIAKELLLRQTGILDAQPGDINVVIASHNQASVDLVRKIRDRQVANGQTPVPLTYAQLYGMADEVSCSLLPKQTPLTLASQRVTSETPRTYKCVTWGSMKDCLNYLLRRAAENKDALSRTRETRDAMRAEIWRRIKTTFVS